MKDIIYADNAATTKMDKDALQAMMPYFSEIYGNASQPYSFARAPKEALKKARETIAECINASPEEIYFTSGGTESDNWTIKGIGFQNPGKRIITSSIEHHAILNSCAFIERQGCPVTYLPVDFEGTVQPDELKKEISENVSLVSVMFSNNEIGTIQPIKELCRIAHENGALFHTDAVQSLGHVRIDVRELGVDFLSASSHKFNGPKGIGFLYIRKGIELLPYADGGSQESGRRAGTENIASIVGMASALCKNVLDIDSNTVHLKNLEKIIMDALDNAEIDYIRNGSKNKVPGNMSLSFRNAEGEVLLHRLDFMGICVSTGSACDSGRTHLSHVLQAIHIPEEYGKGTIRISLGKDNTEKEAEKIASSLIHILKPNE